MEIIIILPKFSVPPVKNSIYERSEILERIDQRLKHCVYRRLYSVSFSLKQYIVIGIVSYSLNQKNLLKNWWGCSVRFFQPYIIALSLENEEDQVKNANQIVFLSTNGRLYPLNRSLSLAQIAFTFLPQMQIYPLWLCARITSPSPTKSTSLLPRVTRAMRRERNRE